MTSTKNFQALGEASSPPERSSSFITWNFTFILFWRFGSWCILADPQLKLDPVRILFLAQRIVHTYGNVFKTCTSVNRNSTTKKVFQKRKWKWFNFDISFCPKTGGGNVILRYWHRSSIKIWALGLLLTFVRCWPLWVCGEGGGWRYFQ